eukprot:1161636-Pelagomonas_calceolata.AAC.4
MQHSEAVQKEQRINCFCKLLRCHEVTTQVLVNSLCYICRVHNAGVSAQVHNTYAAMHFPTKTSDGPI